MISSVPFTSQLLHLATCGASTKNKRQEKKKRIAKIILKQQIEESDLLNCLNPHTFF